MVSTIVRRFAGLVLLCSVQLSAQPTTPRFEVASIREHAPPLHTIMGFTLSGSRVGMEGYTLPQMIMEAYGLKGFWQVSMGRNAGAGADTSTYYDVAARASGEREPTRNEAREMLQALLGERFHLMVHREAKEMPVYALTVSEKGAKLQSGDAAGKCAVNVSPLKNAQKYSYVNCGIGVMVDMMGNGIVDRPVVDHTGLTGTYTFSLAVTPAFMRREDTDAVELSPFSMVQELGLRLEPIKAAVEVIAVDRFEKLSGN